MRVLLSTLTILFLLPLLSASPLTAQNVVLDINTDVEATSSGNPTSITINNTWVPIPHQAQEIQSIDTNEGEQEGNYILYRADNLPFSDTTTFTVYSERNEPIVEEKIEFPLQSQDLPREHLEFTELIDHDEDIQRIANKLAEGEDDLFKLVSKTGGWVTTNIEYDLSTANIEASHPSSEVLTNRNGVCDELTNLFISLLRSNGVPARFMAGYSYTESDLFDEPWGAHGWAEVYFPEYGWVPFDPTYGQYGYSDASHIVFAQGAQGERPQTTYSWRGSNSVDLETDIRVDVLEQSRDAEQQMQVSTTHPEEVGIGSSFKIEHTMYNPTNAYYTTSLQLSEIDSADTLSPNPQTITIPPREQQKVSWTIQIDEDLDETFMYEFPFTIYDQRTKTTENVTVEVSSSHEKKEVTEEPKQEKETSTTCTLPEPTYRNETINIECTSDTAQVTCFEDTCTDIDTTTTLQIPSRNITTSAIELDHSKSTNTVLPVTLVEPPNVFIEDNVINAENVEELTFNNKIVQTPANITYESEWVAADNYTEIIRVEYTDLLGNTKTKELETDVTVSHEDIFSTIKGFVGNVLLSTTPSPILE